MNCKQARSLMQEIADGTRTDHVELDRHIAQCPQCRREWHQLQQISAALAETARCEVSAERLERATVGALQTIEKQRPRSLAGLSRLGWAAAAAALIVAFSFGLYAGRTVWPREVIVTNTVKVPEVRKEIVKVEVPVTKECVVIKRVPVYKTRIVYRERVEPEVKAAMAPEPEDTPPSPGDVEWPDTAFAEATRHVGVVLGGPGEPSFERWQSREPLRRMQRLNASWLVVATPQDRWQPESPIAGIDHDVFMYLPASNTADSFAQVRIRAANNSSQF